LKFVLSNFSPMGKITLFLRSLAFIIHSPIN
jgi:hypothetical protein